MAFSLFEDEVGIWLTTAMTDARGNADGTPLTVSSAGWAGGLLIVFSFTLVASEFGSTLSIC